MARKLLSPKQAVGERELLRLVRTCADTKKSWFLLCHNGIVITNQMNGEPSTGSVKLSRQEFESFVRFFERGQKVPRG